MAPEDLSVAFVLTPADAEKMREDFAAGRPRFLAKATVAGGAAPGDARMQTPDAEGESDTSLVDAIRKERDAYLAQKLAEDAGAIAAANSGSVGNMRRTIEARLRQEHAFLQGFGLAEAEANDAILSAAIAAVQGTMTPINPLNENDRHLIRAEMARRLGKLVYRSDNAAEASEAVATANAAVSVLLDWLETHFVLMPKHAGSIDQMSMFGRYAIHFRPDGYSVRFLGWRDPNPDKASVNGSGVVLFDRHLSTLEIHAEHAEHALRLAAELHELVIHAAPWLLPRPVDGYDAVPGGC